VGKDYRVDGEGENRMKANWMLVIVSLMILLISGCKKTHTPKEQANTPPAPKVAVETVSLTPISETYEAVGTIASVTTSILSSRIVGNIVSIDVASGDEVKAGQLLIQISDADVLAQLSKAKAGLSEAERAHQGAAWAVLAAEAAKVSLEANRDFAEASWTRSTTLVEKGIDSKEAYDQADAQRKATTAYVAIAEEVKKWLQASQTQAMARIEQARADVASAEVQLGYTRITSPVDGVVTAKYVDVGTQAAPGVSLLKIEDNKHYLLEASVAESQVGSVHLGDAAAVTIDALADKPVSGKVSVIVPASDPASRSLVVKLDLPADAGLHSGMFGRAEFVVGHRNAITVPATAIVQRGQLTFVYLVDADGNARLRLVRPGPRRGERVEVLSGLNADERVIVTKADGVKDGERVIAGRR
jgi:multidrug efflux pump subunit AcrA (membrane-fusion protein)